MAEERELRLRTHGVDEKAQLDRILATVTDLDQVADAAVKCVEESVLPGIRAGHLGRTAGEIELQARLVLAPAIDAMEADPAIGEDRAFFYRLAAEARVRDLAAIHGTS